ncbi:alpha/beta hydrolase [Duganella callida]|uniref:Alpha/beta hydrolase n=1 Tax=Duganella callida TaxID=2561932 RepID=A0A4Y9SA05_9BURK|nr:alpha/beta hydrolase [Duganella callida]TFW18678.1 alpha/beta hydrolase [Duganella callida]
MEKITRFISHRIPRELSFQGPQGILQASHWLPEETAASYDNLIVFFHGGYFVANDSESLTSLFHDLTSIPANTALLVLHYTLASTSPFPAALEDGYSALLWAVRNSKALKWSGANLIVAGIEAGANLAASVALVCRDRKMPLLSGQLLIMPMLDPGLTSGSMRDAHEEPAQLSAANRCVHGYRQYLPDVVDRLHPYASPLNAHRLKDLPPALILSADADPLRDEAETYASRLITAGIATSTLRLAAFPLDDHNARSACAAGSEAVSAIAAFLHTIQHRPKPSKPPAMSI